LKVSGFRSVADSFDAEDHSGDGGRNRIGMDAGRPSGLGSYRYIDCGLERRITMQPDSLRVRQLRWIGIIAIWAVSLIFASQWGQAQNRPSPFDKPTVLTGNDIGFQVDQNMGNVVTGTFVVKINGEWVKTGPASPLSNRTAPVK
jgi:hypothetical protein